MSMIFQRTSCRGARRTIRATMPMLMGTVLFSALIIVLMNLIIDISYGFVDPCVRYQ
jgi:ABC-type dipeptide/oligopeptide/nickel transport system permease component